MGDFNGQGALTGAGVGAGIGTAVAPGVGTIIGGAAGGLLGSGLLSSSQDVNAGFGMKQMGPFEKHNTGPGLQNGTANLGGLDMTKPGMAETYAQNALQHYGASGTPQISHNAQSFYGSMPGRQADSAQPTNNSAAYAASYNQTRPQIQPDAGIGQYYDNAEKNAAAGINAQMAKRGMYGSSAATGQLAGMYSNMEGNRARDTADYGLKSDQEQRAQSALGGQLVGQGDTQSNAMAANDRDWTQMAGLAAQGADQNSLNNSHNQLDWTEGLGTLALGGQGAQRNRGQDAFQNEMQIGDRMNGMMGDTYDSMFKGDQDMMDSGQGLNIGLASDNANMQAEKGNGIMSGWKSLLSGIGG